MKKQANAAIPENIEEKEEKNGMTNEQFQLFLIAIEQMAKDSANIAEFLEKFQKLKK